MNIFKKCLRKSLAVGIVSFMFIPPAYADAMDLPFLIQIAQVGFRILNAINQTPVYMVTITQMAQSWISTTDPDNNIATDQALFAQNQNSLTTNLNAQLTASQTFTNQYLLAGSGASTLPTNANDLTYGILFGMALPNTQPPQNITTNQTNFISNIAGLGVSLPQGNPSWKASPAATSYQNFYNTIAAINSYNNFILAGLANAPTQYQANLGLMQIATNSNWFTDIGTEPLGMVLRHLLMFTSQVYVMMEQLIMIQQQMLTTLSTMNTLISMEAQQITGPQLWQKAQMASH